MTTFGAQTTADDVLDGVDLTGSWALVTGASAGLGRETARSLAAHGANLILGVRDPDKGQRAAEPVLAAAAAEGSEVELRTVDLASLASVRAFTDEVAADHDRLALLVANAGVMACPEGRTEDGFEMQIGTNHLGHFVLVNRLVDLLVAGAPSRVVSLSSAGHRLSDVDLDDPFFEKSRYDPWDAYGRSKTANILFSVELDRRLRTRGVRATAVHPGTIVTELGRHLTDETYNALMKKRGDRPATRKSIEAGAATTLWAGVVAPAASVGGRYCEDCSASEITTDPKSATGVNAYAVDPERAKALWERSEELVGESFS